MLTEDEKKKFIDMLCSGECDSCRFHYYACTTKYFYEEPKLCCRLVDVLREKEE